MAAKLPIIASDFQLWKSIIEANNCGLCVNPTDINQIANAIKTIIDNNKKYDIVTCKIRSSSKSLASKITFKTFNLIQRLMPDTFSTGIYMAVKKSDFDRLGGFDETVHQSEDYLYSKQYNKKKINNKETGTAIRSRSRACTKFSKVPPIFEK